MRWRIPPHVVISDSAGVDDPVPSSDIVRVASSTPNTSDFSAPARAQCQGCITTAMSTPSEQLYATLAEHTALPISSTATESEPLDTNIDPALSTPPTMPGPAPDATPKRSPGRPRKSVSASKPPTSASDLSTPKRGRGRPRKVPGERKVASAPAAEAHGRRSGRPRKTPAEASAAAATVPSSRSGRPRKTPGKPRTPSAAAATVPGRGRGRPRNSDAVDIGKVLKAKAAKAKPTTGKMTRGRGRPKKNVAVVMEEKRGRPKKTTAAVAEVKGGRGRPKKI